MGGLGGHDEREQTLNQILTEMDGFSGSEGVVVLAATNRADVLDPALTRPGRFDRLVQVSPPDKSGREAILRIHTREIPLAEGVDLGRVASTTPGMTGAELANLANEAALLAVKRKQTEVTQADLSEALEKVQLGAERPLVMPLEERRRTAYHESGHALLGMLHPGADPVRKITIVPRGRALGVTLSTPDADRYAYTEEYLRGRIIGALGGMAAEQVVYDVITTGAENDLEQVTNLVRGMVGRWGMSERVGRLTAIPSDGQSAYGLSAAPATLDAVDAEMRRIVDECYVEACRLLREHRSQLDDLAEALLAAETLDEAAAYAAMRHPAPVEVSVRRGTAGSADAGDDVAEDVRQPHRAVRPLVRVKRLGQLLLHLRRVGRRLVQPRRQQPAHGAVHVRVAERAEHPPRPVRDQTRPGHQRVQVPRRGPGAEHHRNRAPFRGPPARQDHRAAPADRRGGRAQIPGAGREGQQDVVRPRTHAAGPPALPAAAHGPAHAAPHPPPRP